MSVSMEDRELLELAAEAAGYQPWGSDCEGYPIFVVDSMPIGWNPLTDDGDALRLAIRLRMLVDVGLHEKSSVEVQAHGSNFLCVETGVDAEVVRRAIVRAAAEIGKSMQEKH